MGEHVGNDDGLGPPTTQNANNPSRKQSPAAAATAVAASLSSLSEQVSTLRLQNSNVKETLTALVQTVHTNDAICETVQLALDKVICDADAEINGLQTKCDGLEAERDRITGERDGIRVERDEIRVERDEARDEADRLRRTIEEDRNETAVTAAAAITEAAAMLRDAASFSTRREKVTLNGTWNTPSVAASTAPARDGKEREGASPPSKAPFSFGLKSLATPPAPSPIVPGATSAFTFGMSPAATAASNPVSKPTEGGEGFAIGSSLLNVRDGEVGNNKAKSESPDSVAAVPKVVASSTSDNSNDENDDDPLVSLISHATPHLIGSPHSFAAWLRTSEDVVTPPDLVEAVLDDEYLKESLVLGDGSGGCGVRADGWEGFRDAVLLRYEITSAAEVAKGDGKSVAAAADVPRDEKKEEETHAHLGSPPRAEMKITRINNGEETVRHDGALHTVDESGGTVGMRDNAGFSDAEEKEAAITPCSRITLISKKDIRYEGILYSIDESNATVAVKDVTSFGADGRREDGPVHPLLLFRGDDIKDLHVHEEAEQRQQQQQQPTPGQIKEEEGFDGVIPDDDAAMLNSEVPEEEEQKEKPSPSTSPREESSSWSCQACTYANDDATLVACGMCGTPRSTLNGDSDASGPTTSEAVQNLSTKVETAAPAVSQAGIKSKAERRRQKKREEAERKRRRKREDVEAERVRKEKADEEDDRRQRLELARNEKAEAMAEHERRLKEEEEEKVRRLAASQQKNADKQRGDDPVVGGRYENDRNGVKEAVRLAPSSSSSASSSPQSFKGPAAIVATSAPAAKGSPDQTNALINANRTNLPSPTRRSRTRTRISIEGMRFSRYLYPAWKYAGDDDAGTTAKVSIIFELVQNPAKIEIAHLIARNETLISRLKREAGGLMKKRAAAEDQVHRLEAEAAVLDDVKATEKKLKLAEMTAKAAIAAKEKATEKDLSALVEYRGGQLTRVQQKQNREWAKLEEERPKRQVEASMEVEKERLVAELEAERREINSSAKAAKKQLDEGQQEAIAFIRKSNYYGEETIGTKIEETEKMIKKRKDMIDVQKSEKVVAFKQKEKQKWREFDAKRQSNISELNASQGKGLFSRFHLDQMTKKERSRIKSEARVERDRVEVECLKKKEHIIDELRQETKRIISELAKRTETIQKAASQRKETVATQLVGFEGKLVELEAKYEVKMTEVANVRKATRKLKGNGESEDDQFDISTSRNQCGHTLLMVAAQNNDIETARLCLELGANPNEASADGHTAMFFADYFKLRDMVAIIAEHKGSPPKRRIWDGILKGKAKSSYRVDWDMQLRISEKAAIPADTLLASAESLENDNEWKMQLLTPEERRKDFTAFDSVLINPDPSNKNIRRVVLLEKDCCDWLLTAGASSKGDFSRFIERLKPARQRREKQSISVHRRAVIGMKKPFEVLCAALNPSALTRDSPVALFTRFVASESHGVFDTGVLVWAITSDGNASLFKTLIEEAEFRRNKVDDDDDRFPDHREAVLELGREMHLLDLKTTSIWTSSPMELFTFDIDEGELELLGGKHFVPKKRMVHSEQQMRDALFSTSKLESKENQGILSNARVDMSTNLSGGAGTGKTALLIKKVISEGTDKKILVLSRLPRLVSSTKTAVAEAIDSRNIAFLTYEELATSLAREVEPEDESERHNFLPFAQVHFGGTTGTGTTSSVSFVKDFVEGFLQPRERKAMKKCLVEPITLWTAICVIKSNVKCSLTKAHLSREEYMSLPRSFGLNQTQRTMVYDLYLRYEEWRTGEGTFKWDEADRTLYIWMWGGSVFVSTVFVSWEERVVQRGEIELLGEDGKPIPPFFYDMVFADEAQDFSDLDLALFVRMSGNVRCVFLGGDPAQSVELGVRMRLGTVNDVFNSCVPENVQVKSVLQNIQMKTNHRTHAQNLELAKAVRKILSRSFGVPGNPSETALMNGPIPEALLLPKMRDLGVDTRFRGGNIVFIAPDEYLSRLRVDFHNLGIKNDVFGIREAKGLEFGSVALVGFFSHFDKLENEQQWKNVIRWLHSKHSITKTESGEKIEGKQLEECDYVLSHPEVEDQAMMLYTALTRARERLYFIEAEEEGKKRKGGRGGLAEFAFHHLKKLGLVKVVDGIDEGESEMTAQQHKARGVLLVTQAIELSRNFGSTKSVKEKFSDAASRFRPEKGNDSHLLDQCNKHLDAILLKRSLIEAIKTKFFDKKKGEYVLEGRFADILKFEEDLAKFFRMCANDSFLVEEVQEIRALIEDVFTGTPFEIHFGEIWEKMKVDE